VMCSPSTARTLSIESSPKPCQQQTAAGARARVCACVRVRSSAAVASQDIN
jgi:hypothetical protein